MKDAHKQKRLPLVVLFCFALKRLCTSAYVALPLEDLRKSHFRNQPKSHSLTPSRREAPPTCKQKRPVCSWVQVASSPESTAEDDLSSRQQQPTPKHSDQDKQSKRPIKNISSVGTTNRNVSNQARPTSSSSTWKNNNSNNNNNSINSNNNNNNSNNNYRNNNNFNSVMDPAKALNKKLVACESAKEVLDVVTSSKLMMTQCAGGGTMNSINFSTSLHRIARHVAATFTTRAQVLSDPRFALLLCSLAEGMAGLDHTQSLSSVVKAVASADTITAANLFFSTTASSKQNRLSFQAREMSNIAWALAKLRLLPPQSIYPMTPPPAVASSSYDSSAPTSLLFPLYRQLVETSFQVRSQLLQAARRRKQSNDGDPHDADAGKPLWVATLSQLAAMILDTISYSVLAKVNTSFQSQEWANLLWAMATSQRADPLVFDSIALRLMEGMQRQQQQQQPQWRRSQIQSSAVRPQECSNSIWAFATARITGPVQEQLLVFVSNLMEAPDFVEVFMPQELSNTAWGVATLLAYKKQQQQGKGSGFSREEEQAALRIFRHVAKSLISRPDQFKSQELSNSAWAMATLGFGQWSATGARTRASENIELNEYIVLASDQIEADEILLSEAFQALARSALPRLSSFRSQELNNLAWSLARLLGNSNTCEGLQPSRFSYLLEGIGLELRDPRRKATSQDVGTTLWSFATLEYFNAEIYRGIASRLDFQRGRDYKPQELSNTLWALANNPDLFSQCTDVFDTTFAPVSVRKEMMARADPVIICFATGASELIQRPYDFKPQEIKDVLWSFSKANLRHPMLFRSAAQHLVGSHNDSPQRGTQDTGRGLDLFSPQGLGNLAWAYARQAQLAQEASQRYDIRSSMQGRLAVYTASYLDVGEILIKRLFATIATSNLEVHDQLSKLKPQDLANSCWAFAVLGLKHTGFLKAAHYQLLDRMSRFIRRKDDPFMTRFKGQELANLVWALATLNCRFMELPSAIAPYMVSLCSNDQGVSNAKSISRVFKRQELANLAWSCTVIDSYPDELMQLLYSGLVGHPNESDPVYLRQLYGDSGLQLQAMMSLLYLQISLDTDNQQNNWVLPENFPEGWYTMADSSSGASDGMDTSSEFELNLSTSKIQKDVSHALSRIGFDHVQEHVISMKELAEHGIQFAPLPIKILSIDIADVSRKVGIEVDGPAHFLSLIDGSVYDIREGETSVINGKLVYQFRWDGEHQQPNGPTESKQRLLTALGWKVIHLPFWEWDALNGDTKKEEDYCRNLLSRI